MQTELSRLENAATENTSRSQREINLASMGLILASVLLAAAGQLTFKAALNQIGQLQLSLEMFIKLVTSPTLLLGLGIFGVSALLWLFALMRAELSFAYPFLSLSYVTVLLGGALLFHEQITPGRFAGFLLIIIGLFVVARGERQKNNSSSA